MKKISFMISFVWMVLISNAQVAGEIKINCDKNLSVLTYGMNHPMHEWTGDSKNFTSVILTDKDKKTISKVAVSVKINSFDTQNANRDSHTIEVTDALKFPSVTFSSEKIVQNGEKLSVTGVLSFHGVKRRITFDAIQKNANGKIEVSGGFAIKMTDYNIDPPTLLGVAAEDLITIKFKTVY